MSIELSILGWKVQGLRCPDYEVSFEDGDNIVPVTLIQMPNGTGKTTTLSLLRLALSGAAEKAPLSREEIKEFQKRNSAITTGMFQVRLLCNSERRITITLEFDFSEGRVEYKTTLPGVGIQAGFKVQPQFRSFMRPDFINYLVFDGELAEHFLSKKYTDAQLIIENLFQLDLFRKVQQKASDYWDMKTDNAGTRTDKGLNQKRNQVTSLRRRIKTLEDEKAALEGEQKTVSKRLQEMRSAFDAALLQRDEGNKKAQKTIKGLEESQREKKEKIKEVLEIMRLPHAMSRGFSEEMINLKSNLDILRLPESTAREFFEELAQAVDCLCGRPLDDEHRLFIKEQSHRYLAGDDSALLNAIKGAISDHMSEDSLKGHSLLTKELEQLNERVKKENDFRTDLEKIQNEAGEEDPALKTAKQEIEGLSDRQKEIEIQLRKFQDTSEYKDIEANTNIGLLKRALKSAEESLAVATSTLALKKKTEILKNILGKAYDLSLHGVNTDILQASNGRIAELMPYNDIRIEKIDSCLRLKDQGGGSVGETLSVAYAFLSTLFNRSDFKLPFVVDSPANPIDLKVRSNVAKVIPGLSKQFIAFTISSERQNFVTELKQHANNNIKFFTLFRKGPNALEDSARKVSGFKETDDGILVPGFEFFNSFQIEKE